MPLCPAAGGTAGSRQPPPCRVEQIAICSRAKPPQFGTTAAPLAPGPGLRRQPHEAKQRRRVRSGAPMRGTERRCAKLGRSRFAQGRVVQRMGAQRITRRSARPPPSDKAALSDGGGRAPHPAVSTMHLRPPCTSAARHGGGVRLPGAFVPGGGRPMSGRGAATRKPRLGGSQGGLERCLSMFHHGSRGADASCASPLARLGCVASYTWRNLSMATCV